jgi:hypothetical protein
MQMIEAAIGFVGVIVGASMTWLQTLWLENKKRKESRSYIVILIVFLLDRFIQGCVDVVSDTGIPDQDGCLVSQVFTPDIDFKSLKADWKVFPNDLIYEILDLPNKIETANHMISSVAEYVAGPPDYEEVYEERQFQYSNLGITAYKLAKKLREQNNLPKRDFENWNPIEFLEKENQEIESRRKKREAQQTKMMNELQKNA